MPPAAPPAQQPKMISVAPMTPGGPQREFLKLGEIKKEKIDSNNNGNPESQRATNSPNNPFNRPTVNNNQDPKPPVSSGILKLMRFGDIKKERVDQSSNQDSQDNKRPKFNNDMGM